MTTAVRFNFNSALSTAVILFTLLHISHGAEIDWDSLTLKHTIQHLDESNPSRQFGDHVGSNGIAIYENVAAIGIASDDHGGSCQDCGRVLVVERASEKDHQWKFSAWLQNPLAENEFFGYDVAIWYNVIAVGAPAWQQETGRVLVWEHTQTLTARDAAELERFGSAVDLHSDRLIVGAPRGDGPFNDQGAAYVFNLRNSSLWVEEQKLTHPNPNADDEFGFAVALSSDSAQPSTVLISATFEDSCNIENLANDGCVNGGICILYRNRIFVFVNVLSFLTIMLKDL